MKSALVMEAFEQGVAAFGVPQEALTDNGRASTPHGEARPNSRRS